MVTHIQENVAHFARSPNYHCAQRKQYFPSNLAFLYLGPAAISMGWNKFWCLTRQPFFFYSKNRSIYFPVASYQYDNKLNLIIPYTDFNLKHSIRCKTNPLKLSSALIKKISSSTVLDEQRVILVDRIFPAENKDSSGLSAAVRLSQQLCGSSLELELEKVQLLSETFLSQSYVFCFVFKVT